MARIQLALDDISSDAAILLIHQMDPMPDIIEAGTLMLLKEGTSAITKLKNSFPEVTILADPKIMDASNKMAAACFDAGADIVTIMGVCDPATLQKAAKSARRRNKKLSVDLLHADQMPDLEDIKDVIDTIGLHTPISSGRPDFNGLKRMKETIPEDCRISIAGSIGKSNACQLSKLDPDVVIVGRSILNSENPSQDMQIIQEAFS